MARSKAFSDSVLVHERKKDIFESREYYPPDPLPPIRWNWVKIGMIAIIAILVITIANRAADMSEDIERINLEIEEEAKTCLKKFSSLGCPLDNMDESGQCRSLYDCARKTKSTEHIRSFFEKAAYMAVF